MKCESCKHNHPLTDCGDCLKCKRELYGKLADLIDQNILMASTLLAIQDDCKDFVTDNIDEETDSETDQLIAACAAIYDKIELILLDESGESFKPLIGKAN